MKSKVSKSNKKVPVGKMSNKKVPVRKILSKEVYMDEDDALKLVNADYMCRILTSCC